MRPIAPPGARDPRGARRHRLGGARQGFEHAALRSKRSSPGLAALSQARAVDPIVSVELTYRDGTVSEIKSFRR
jgi:hypothetical protein